MVQKRIMGIFSYYVPLDKQMEYDDMFYGINAKPQSKEYSKHLQKQIYQMVEFMQGPTTISNFLPRVVKTLNLAWHFDKANLHVHIINNFKRIVRV